MLRNIDNSVSFTALNLKLPQNCKGHKKLQNVVKIIDNQTKDLPNSTLEIFNKGNDIFIRHHHDTRNAECEISLTEENFYQLLKKEDNILANCLIKLHKRMEKAENKYTLLVNFHKEFGIDIFSNLLQFSKCDKQINKEFKKSNDRNGIKIQSIRHNAQNIFK